MVKKWIAALVMLGLLTCLVLPVVADSGKGEFSVETYATWVGGAPTPDSPVTNYLEQKTGVYFSEIRGLNGADQDQKLNMDMASNHLPDLMYTGNVPKLISADKIIQLDKYFNDAKNYPNLAKIDKSLVNAWKQPDGHIYNLPHQHVMGPKNIPATNIWWGKTGWWVRSDLLQKVKMKVSDLATLSGLEKYITKAAALKDPQGRNYIGFGLDPNASSGSMVGTFGIQTMNPTKTGLNPDWSTPQYKAMVQWLNKLYRAGLLDPEAATQNNEGFKAKTLEDRYACAFGSCDLATFDSDRVVLGKQYGTVESTKHVRAGWMAIPTPKQPGVKIKPYNYLSVTGWTSGGISIAKTCKNPDKLMKLVDYLLSPEGQLVALYGIPGAGMVQQGDGSLIADKKYNDDFYANPWALMNSGKVDLWYWSYNFSMNWVPQSAKFEGKQFKFTPDSYRDASDRKVAYSVILSLKEHTMQIAPAWQIYPNRTDGLFDKYNATLADTAKKYFANMVAADSAAKVDSLYNDFKAEMESRGHASEVLAEQFADYNAFLKTPGGQAVSKMKLGSKFVADSFNWMAPVEKGVPGVYYGNGSEWYVKSN